MHLQISHLRRWLVLAACLLSLAVAGAYVHRRRQVRDVLKQIPAKMNLDIQQTAQGFKVSKSDQGRTLFTIQASKAVQFKLGGRAELHNVTITLYGRDSSRTTRFMATTLPTIRRLGTSPPKATCASIWKQIQRAC